MSATLVDSPEAADAVDISDEGDVRQGQGAAFVYLNEEKIIAGEHPCSIGDLRVYGDRLPEGQLSIFDVTHFCSNKGAIWVLRYIHLWKPEIRQKVAECSLDSVNEETFGKLLLATLSIDCIDTKQFLLAGIKRGIVKKLPELEKGKRYSWLDGEVAMVLLKHRQTFILLNHLQHFEPFNRKDAVWLMAQNTLECDSAIPCFMQLTHVLWPDAPKEEPVIYTDMLTVLKLERQMSDLY